MVVQLKQVVDGKKAEKGIVRTRRDALKLAEPLKEDVLSLDRGVFDVSHFVQCSQLAFTNDVVRKAHVYVTKDGSVEKSFVENSATIVPILHVYGSVIQHSTVVAQKVKALHAVFANTNVIGGGSFSNTVFIEVPVFPHLFDEHKDIYLENVIIVKAGNIKYVEKGKIYDSHLHVYEGYEVIAPYVRMSDGVRAVIVFKNASKDEVLELGDTSFTLFSYAGLPQLLADEKFSKTITIHGSVIEKSTFFNTHLYQRSEGLGFRDARIYYSQLSSSQRQTHIVESVVSDSTLEFNNGEVEITNSVISLSKVIAKGGAEVYIKGCVLDKCELFEHAGRIIIEDSVINESVMSVSVYAEAANRNNVML